jgi:hypothetical protein
MHNCQQHELVLAIEDTPTKPNHPNKTQSSAVYLRLILILFQYPWLTAFEILLARSEAHAVLYGTRYRNNLHNL